MNPQPNSHDHPEVIEKMELLDEAEWSLNDFREKRKYVEDLGTLGYDSLLVSKVREARKELEFWCKHYAIVIV